MNIKFSELGFEKRKSWILFFKGFAMGIADIIPGVSGGTIAFIAGIYDQLLSSISSLDDKLIKKIIKGQWHESLLALNISFLLPLVFGIASAILLTAKLVHYCMEFYPTQTWSLFFGLIFSSIIVVFKKLEKSWPIEKILSLLIGAIVGWALVSLIPVQTPDAFWFIFLSGAVAITAMILPGISGSFILVILGKYHLVTGALKTFWKPEQLLLIIVFSSGCLFGLISFSKFLKWLLENKRQIILSFLTGLMIGSMKKIYPWRQVIETREVAGKTIIIAEKMLIPIIDTNFVICLSLMLIGAISVIYIEKKSEN